MLCFLASWDIPFSEVLPFIHWYSLGLWSAKCSSLFPTFSTLPFCVGAQWFRAWIMHFPFPHILPSEEEWTPYLDMEEPVCSAPSRANNQPLRLFYLQASWNIQDNLGILQSAGADRRNGKLYYKPGWATKIKNTAQEEVFSLNKHFISPGSFIVD